MYQAEARERRVVQMALRTVVSGLLAVGQKGPNRADPPNQALLEFTRELFPERRVQEERHDRTAAKVLEDYGEDPLPVQAVGSTGSAYGERLRSSRIRVVAKKNRKGEG